MLVPWVQPIELGDGLLELRADQAFYPLRHPIFATAFRAVADRLRGENELEAITADLPADVEPATVVVLLKMLRSIGLLLDGSELAESEGAARERLLFLSHFTVQPEAVEQRLAAATVQIVGSETLVERVARQLEAAGCGHVAPTEISGLEAREPADLLVACADAPARDYLSLVNVATLKRRQPWLRIAAHGPLAWLGPLVVPGETACFACLETRERANARGRGDLPDLELGSIGAFAPQTESLAAQAAAEVVRFLGGVSTPGTVGNVYEMSAASPLTQRHVLLRDPCCLVCGGLWPEGP